MASGAGAPGSSCATDRRGASCQGPQGTLPSGSEAGTFVAPVITSLLVLEAKGQRRREERLGAVGCSESILGNG